LYGILFLLHRKIVELEEELRVVGNNLKSLEVSEEKVSVILSLMCLALRTQSLDYFTFQLYNSDN